MADDKSISDVTQKSARQPIKDWPISERPREKLLQLGPEGLSDGELLAVLLRIGKLGQSAEDMGRQLLTQFDGISGIDRAHISGHSVQIYGYRQKTGKVRTTNRQNLTTMVLFAEIFSGCQNCRCTAAIIRLDPFHSTD